MQFLSFMNEMFTFHIADFREAKKIFKETFRVFGVDKSSSYGFIEVCRLIRFLLY